MTHELETKRASILATSRTSAIHQASRPLNDTNGVHATLSERYPHRAPRPLPQRKYFTFYYFRADDTRKRYDFETNGVPSTIKNGRCLSSTLITLDVHTWVRRCFLGPETTPIFKLVIGYRPGIARYRIGWSSARAPLRSARRGVRS